MVMMRFRPPQPSDPILNLMPRHRPTPRAHPVVLLGVSIALLVLIVGLFRNFQ